MLGKYIGGLFRSVENFSEKLQPATRPLIRFPPWLRFSNFHGINFILLHYIYLLVMTLLGSGIMAGGRNIPYVDSLFFSAGAATQSGLNTVDVNKLFTYQQTLLMLMACLCNPIVINTFVVFVRLYWFEKRFQHVVAQANDFRRQRTRSRSKSEDRKDHEWIGAREERPVGSRPIQVLHNQTGTHFAGTEKDAIEVSQDKKTSQRSTDNDTNTGDETREEPSALDMSNFHRDITFADQLPNKHSDRPNEERRMVERPAEQHIKFIENQRHPKDSGALRIPGPRDWDRGDVPHLVQDGQTDTERGRRRQSFGNNNDAQSHPAEMNADDHPLKRDFEADHSKKHRLIEFAKAHSLTRRSHEGDDDAKPTMLRDRATSRTRTFTSFLSRDKEDFGPNPYLSYEPTVGRNSTFVNLTEEQREELGGIEYRSLKTLAYILIGYFFAFSILGIIIYIPWIHLTPKYKSIVQQNGQGAPWWGFYTAMSSFTDLGFTLTPDSMSSFNQAAMPMLMGSFLIIVGNTGFPCMLRFVIWLMTLVVPHGSGVWEELRFLLDHPRRCFTLLFPRKATWWLFFVLILLNGIDLVFFIILDIHDETVTSLPGSAQFLDGLFQAASTRTAGFSCVNLATLHPAIQVSYLVMMYISVFPIAISVRQTNVYEEKSLGIYSDDSASPGDPDSDSDSDGPPSYLGSHLRRQLSFDLWYVFLGLFLICIIEGDRLANSKQTAFTIFAVLFEIVSAYGTVGLSLGYPGINASLSAEFRPLSKLIVVAMMLRGRHRGLPYALDRAILLPSDSGERKAAEEVARRVSAASHTHTGVDGAAPTSGGGTFPISVSGRAATVPVGGDSDGHSLGKKRSRMPKGGLVAALNGVLGAGPVHKGKTL